MKVSLFILFFSTQIAGAATYSVPVQDDLKEYASFELKTFNLKRYIGKTTVKYKLPIELTGIEQKVEFTGIINSKAQQNILTGDNGTMICEKNSEARISCQVEYKNLEIDEKQAISNIVQSSTTRSEIVGKIQVMRAFSSEPVGIITY